MKLLYRGLCCLGVMLYAGLPLRAQDTMRITLPDAESLFIQKNLNLLAEKYNIQIARAQLIQAKLYANPNVSFTGNMYNPVQKKWLDISNQTGEYIVSAQQLILLAGKRNKQIQLARTAVESAENQFYDLLRTLRYTLRTDFFRLYFLQQSIDAYQQQIQMMITLDRNFQQLLAKEKVSAKDALRIRSLLISLQLEQASLQQQFMVTEAELQQLLQNNQTMFLPQWQEDLHPAIAGQLKLPDLMDTAAKYRPDLLLLQYQVKYSHQNLQYQKALAVPDLTLGAQFDKRGSFVENSSFFSLAIDLPFFNRNQGNIQAAKYAIEQHQLLVQQAQARVRSETQTAYLQLLQSDRLLQQIDPSFSKKYQQLLEGVTQNFLKGNLSLLDFTDYADSYKQSVLQLNQLYSDRMQTIENLNYTCGKIIIEN